MQSITVKIKNVYGNERIYPVCDNAKTFALLTSKKTLDRYDIDKIKSLGYIVKVENDNL